MNILLSTICGVIVTVMTIFNGELSTHYGVYVSTAMIHLIGLLTFILIMCFKKEKLSFKQHVPLYLYTGGMIGVLTVIFNVITVNAMGVALLTALGLLGQMITSIVLEQYGWLGMIQRKMTVSKLMSLVIVAIGIGVMII